MQYVLFAGLFMLSIVSIAIVGVCTAISISQNHVE